MIRCLGVDAPWPVAKTKEILRKACPDEISKGIPILSAEERAKSNLWFAPGRTSKVPEVDWADAFPEQEEGQNGTIAGFVPADQEKYHCKSKVDLREKGSFFSGNSWMPCEFRFRGLAVEVAKLKRYAKQNGIHISWDGSVSEDIREIWVVADDKTMHLIEKFPALKVTGLAEEWWRQEVYVMYSESGFNLTCFLQVFQHNSSQKVICCPATGFSITGTKNFFSEIFVKIVKCLILCHFYLPLP